MASYRIGIGSFNLKDGNIGIGTETTGFGNLKVEGTIKTTDLDVGISTFTRYSGFEAEQTNIIRDASYGGNESVTYTITVIGGIFYIDGVSAPILTLKRGTTYTFDQSPNTNNGHPLRFKDGDGNTYSSGVVATGTPGSLEAKVTFVVPSNAPDDLRYYCTVHGNGMGNTISVINRTPSNLETTGDIVVDTGKTLTVGSGATISVGSVECISVKHHFSVPVGDTAGRNKSSGYAEGTVRYNRDLGTMEFFNGNEWRQFNYQSDASNSPSRRGRGLIQGGKSSPTWTTSVESIETATQGNATTFGDLTLARGYPNCTSDGTRGIAAGGAIYPAGPTTFSNTIDYNTIASEGNSIDFGDAQGGTSPGLWGDGACASSTRAVLGSWSNVSTNIDYIQMQTLGNSLDFGDKSGGAVAGGVAGVSSPTRGVWGGGYFPYNSPVAGYNSKDIIEFVTIANTGNTTDFGNLTRRKNAAGGASNSVRGVFAAGYVYHGSSGNNGTTSSVDYITIASTGNAIEFGQLTNSRSHGSGMGTGTRGIFAGMGGAPSLLNIIDFISFASTGDATDFGDLSLLKREGGCATDSHGGLGGF